MCDTLLRQHTEVVKSVVENTKKSGIKITEGTAPNLPAEPKDDNKNQSFFKGLMGGFLTKKKDPVAAPAPAPSKVQAASAGK